MGSLYNKRLIKRIDNGFFVLEGDNQEKATADILSMNSCIAKANSICHDIPNRRINKESIRFTPAIAEDGTRTYCIISFSPLTPSGKKSKYPITLNFFPSSKLFGELNYGETGDVEKARIIIWSVGVCFELQLTTISSILDVNIIYKTVTNPYKKEKIYQAPKQTQK